MNNKVKFLRGTAAEYANAVKDDDTFYYTTDDEKFYVGSKEITGGGITVDSNLSDTSTNPVQNKVIKAAIDEKADKTVATTTADGLMSAEDKVKLDGADDTYASKAKYGDTTINVGRKAGTAVGEYSTAEGKDTTAMGNYSHSEGMETSASGAASHAEGYSTYAVGYDSHSGGYATTAKGNISFAHGYHVISKNDYEIALGKCNVSTDNSTLFSVGNGTDENNRHNAFEITTTGGKLHDKDIATTDMSLPANGGNADTLGGIVDAYHLGTISHNDIGYGNDFQVYCQFNYDASRFEFKETSGNYIIGVDYATNADTAETISEWGRSPVSDLDTTNLGFVAASSDANAAPNTFWSTVLTVGQGTSSYAAQLAFPWSSQSDQYMKYRVLDNGVWHDWIKIYTSVNKPYVTGSATIAAGDNTCITNHGFTPSAVLWWENSGGREIRSASSFNTTSFNPSMIDTSERVLNYIIFK